MLEFILNKEIKGTQLEEELGLPFGSVYVRNNTLVILNQNLSQEEVYNIIKKHIPHN